MKSRTLLLSVFALSACVADPDPDRPDASGAGGASESGGASGSGGEHASGDASVDALLHEPDVYSGPGCVSPVDGECPDGTTHITYGSFWNPQEGCWRRNEIVSCFLDELLRSFGEAKFCREDGTPFWVPEIECIPFPARMCTPAEANATTPVSCPDE
ncbi:hypothetical protein L6V77_24010 [Myxococcota bacterium]|nr:hypothetical protein [Myxococcota bacterium]